jgi:periplasmic protein TonB
VKRLLPLLLLAGCAVVPIPIPLPVETSTPVSETYRRDFAQKVAAVNRDAIADSLPEMLKSVVVLSISLDSRGNLTDVSVRRSNGYADLEGRAMQSVRRAAPFAAPGESLSFLETFLFRDDGRFQIRSLVN